MPQETARIGVWHTASIRDETGKLIYSAAYWGEPNGEPITDPSRIAALEARMAEEQTGAEFKVGDTVAILDDEGERTGQEGPITEILGNGTFIVEADGDNGKQNIGTQTTHMELIEAAPEADESDDEE